MLDIKFSVAKGDDADVAIDKALSSIYLKERLLLCGHESRENFINSSSHNQRSVESILKASHDIDITELFLDDRIWIENELSDRNERRDYDFEDLEGTWPMAGQNNYPFDNLSKLLYGARRRYENKLLVAELYTEHPSDVLAHFKYGNWNCCPKSEIHCATWRYWQERYGAYIIFINHDVIWAKVDQPPLDKRQAIELAWEHYYYCRDTVGQVADSIKALAAHLLAKDVWCFWWD